MGAPLVTVYPDFDVVYGFASFGDCGKDDKPFVYTRMSLFVEWVNSAVCAYADDKDFANCPGPTPTSPSAAPVLSPTPAPADPNTIFFSIISDTETGAGTFRCGGVLIHDDVIVTSAECILQSSFNNDAYVRVGYTSDTVSATVSKIKAAYYYNNDVVPKQENLPDDIGLIILAAPVSGVAFPVSWPGDTQQRRIN